MTIRSEVHTDDYAVEAKFDAEPYFEAASDEDLLELARCDWGGDYPADAVAQFMAEKVERVERVFVYLSFNPTNYGEPVGFECHVDSEDATRWIAENRPALALRIEED